MKVRDIIKLLERDGWYLKATKGSHRQYKHPSKPGRVTLPGHPNDDLPPGTLNSVLKQAGFEAQILAASRESPKSAASRLLVANKGFVAACDERLAAAKAIGGEGIDSVTLVGGFADPFEAPA